MTNNSISLDGTSMKNSLLSYLVLLLIVLSSCKGTAQDENPCGIGPANGLVDGGIVCGQPFPLHDDLMDPSVFGLRAHIAVAIDLAGVVRTQAEATVHAMLDMSGLGEHGEGPGLVRICDVRFPPIPIPGQVQPTNLSLVPEAYEALSDTQVFMSIPDQRTCGGFTTGWGTFLFAVRLSQPESGPLPSGDDQGCRGTSDLDCHFDLELDGEAGATMTAEHMPGLDVDALYVVLRTQVSLAGTIVTSSMMVGEVGFLMDMQILGCRVSASTEGPSAECNHAQKQLISALRPRIYQLARPSSVFAAIRVPGGFTCEDLLQDSDRLFGR